MIVLPHRYSKEAMHISAWLTRELYDVSQQQATPATTLVGSEKFCLGDRVEVEFEGQWFVGEILSINAESGVTSIHCDADPPDVITEAPVDSLRKLPTRQLEQKDGAERSDSNAALQRARSAL